MAEHHHGSVQMVHASPSSITCPLAMEIAGPSGTSIGIQTTPLGASRTPPSHDQGQRAPMMMAFICTWEGSASKSVSMLQLGRGVQRRVWPSGTHRGVWPRAGGKGAARHCLEHRSHFRTPLHEWTEVFAGTKLTAYTDHMMAAFWVQVRCQQNGRGPLASQPPPCIAPCSGRANGGMGMSLCCRSCARWLCLAWAGGETPWAAHDPRQVAPSAWRITSRTTSSMS